MRLDRILLAVLLTLCAAAVLFLPHAAFAQARSASRGGGFTEIKWDVYIFKFLPGNRMAQVIDANGHVIATILDYGGELKLMPTITGPDADKLAKSFQAWKDSGGEAAVGYKPASTQPSGGAASTTAAPPKSALTVDGVVSMLEAGISEDLILEKIHKSGQSFDLSAEEMVRLKKAKASDNLIKAMMEPASAPVASPAPTPSSSPASAQPAPAAAATPPPNGPSKPKSEGGLGSVFHATSDILNGRSVIDRVGLRNILPQWDPHRPLAEQFPHVAIIVHYAPMGWMDPYLTDKGAQGKSIITPCFKLEAVVWSDAQTSKRVPFEWCSNKDEFLDRLEPDYISSLVPRHMDRQYGTGVNRTEGPEPPDRLIPDDRVTLDMEAKTDPHGHGIDLNHDNITRFAIMFANIRKDLGQTLTNDGDPRVWIVTIQKAAGPSLF